MPSWLIPVAEFLVPKILNYGFNFLEKKNPGIKPILDSIIKWVQGQSLSGNGPQAVTALGTHVDKIVGNQTAVLPDLK